jgi:hypothetical protein
MRDPQSIAPQEFGMRKIVQAVFAMALAAPLGATAANASMLGAGSELGAKQAHRADLTLVAAGPRAGGPGGTVRGGGFRGGYRGGFRGGYYGPRFRGGIFIGPSFGYYDPFWYPYSYPYGYYAPPVIVRERYYGPPPDYLPEPEGPPPEQNWYHCSNPDGYYPYVRSCEGEWQPVPVSPEGGPPPDGPQGGGAPARPQGGPPAAPR